MIPSASIEKFIKRPRKDYRTFKELTYRELDKMVDKLPVEPPIWDILSKHQKVCFIIGAQLGHFAFLLDTGMGKTLLSTALARYFRKLKKLKHAIALVPNRVNKDEWAREIRKHSPHTSFCVLRGSSQEKWKQLLESEDTLIIETYAGLMRMVCKIVKNKKGDNKLRINPTLIKRLLKKIDGLFMDESTIAKNKKSLYYRVCRQISTKVNIRFALTGTPFGRDPVDLWSQLFLVDHGETLGQTLGLFRATFFSEKENFWGGSEWTFLHKKQPILNRFLAHSSIRYEADQADLPTLVPIIKYVTLPVDAQTYYDRAREAVLAARGDYRETQNAFMRLRQISSGWLGYYDDEDGRRAQIDFKPNRKLDLALSIVESIPPEKKILMFHDFVFSGSMLERELTKMGVGFVRLMRKTKDPGELLRQFNEDPEKQVFILSTAGAFGLNLQIAQYGIFFESPVPVIARKQLIRRFERQHSLHKTVFLYDLCCKNTVDERILQFHSQGEDLFQSIINGKVQII